MRSSALQRRLCPPRRSLAKAGQPHEKSTSESEDGQRAHRADKQAKPSPLNVSPAYLLNIFFGPASTLQRFNASTRSEAAMCRREPVSDFSFGSGLTSLQTAAQMFRPVSVVLPLSNRRDLCSSHMASRVHVAFSAAIE